MTSTLTRPLVSIVVPVLNGEETIAACLTSLASLSYPREKLEMIVVDNGSTDGTAEIAARYPVRIVREQRRGLSHARNRGIEASGGEIVAFTDTDCTVSTGWLVGLVGELERGEAEAVAGEVHPYPPATAAQRYVARRKPGHAAWQRGIRVPWFNFMNAALRRDVFQRVGCFDACLVSCEDIDFAWRFQEAGLRLVRRADVVVFHRLRGTPRGLFRQARRDGRGWAALTRKRPDVVSWEWRDEAMAWSDLAGSALGVAGTYLPGGRDRVSERDHEYARLDFLRKLGQRVGFVEGTLRAGAPTRSEACSNGGGSMHG